MDDKSNGSIWLTDRSRILVGDVRETLRQIPDETVDCVVTSPPYWGLRDYGKNDQIGLEKTPDSYVSEIVGVFSEVKRVLKSTGTLWLNIGDSYASFRDGKATPDTTRRGSTGTLVPKGSAANRMASTFVGTSIKHKDLVGIPWRVAFAMQSDGWYLRQDIIWAKPNPMPESVADRCTKSHEYLFLMSKSAKYHFDSTAISEPAKSSIVDASGKSHETRNKRSVWNIQTQPFRGAHFAVMPESLVEPCVLAGCPENGIVFDPFLGSGTVAVVAQRLNRDWLGCELNPDYAQIAVNRINGELLKIAAQPDRLPLFD